VSVIKTPPIKEESRSSDEPIARTKVLVGLSEVSKPDKLIVLGFD
jgi:hypothetical protein